MTHTRRRRSARFAPGSCGAGAALVLLASVIGALALVVKAVNEYGAGIVFLVLSLAALACLGPFVLPPAYHFLKGRRNRDAGIPCVQCQRTAFPVGKETTHYRCWNCGCRFDGPEHS
jgi:hypothetical protein